LLIVPYYLVSAIILATKAGGRSVRFVALLGKDLVLVTVDVSDSKGVVAIDVVHGNV